MTNQIMLTALFCFLCLSLSSVHAATKCYTCSTSTNPDCETVSKLSPEMNICKTTTGNDINCVMYKFLLNGNDIMYRGCRQKQDTCEDIANAIKQEYKTLTDCQLCDTDLCDNSVSRIHLPTTLFIITFITIKLFN